MFTLLFFFIIAFVISINTDSSLTKFSFRRAIERELVYCQHFFSFVYLFSSFMTNIDSSLNKCAGVCSIQRIFLCCVKSHPLCFVSVAFPYLFLFRFALCHSTVFYIIRRPVCTGSILPLFETAISRAYFLHFH